MVTESKPTHPVPLDDERVREQLAELFGESLFGPWPELQQNDTKHPKRRRTYAWIWKLLTVIAVVAVAWGGQMFFAPGLKRQVEDRRENYAEELQHFINDGALERVAEFVRLVRTNPEAPVGQSVQPIDAKDPHLDLIVRAEAALYRYFDADPERLKTLQPLLGQLDEATLSRQIADLTLQSREERADKFPIIESLRRGQLNDNELEYLFATALDAKGDVDAARDAYGRSAKLGPAWLGHRFEQAWFELRHDRKNEAQKIARQMERVDPDSPWSRLALATCELARDSDVPQVREQDASLPSVTPVQTYFEALQQAMAAARRGNDAEGRARLLAAMAAIHNQRPFLFDAYDWLLEEKQFELARVLIQSPEWPSDDKRAQARLDRLTAAKSNQPPAGSAVAAKASKAAKAAEAKAKVTASSRPMSKRKVNSRAKK